MRTFIRSTLLLTGLLLSGLSAHAAEPARSIVTVKDADYFGFDLRTVQSVTLDQCQTACVDDTQCGARHHLQREGQVVLPEIRFQQDEPFPGAVAGKVVLRQAEADIGAPTALGFLSEQQVNDAKNQRNTLAVDINQTDIGMDALLYIARNDVISARSIMR